MKVNKVKTQEVYFKPFELRITVETVEEYYALQDLMAFDVTVPQLVFPGDAKGRDTLNKVMNHLREGLQSQAVSANSL